MGNEMGNRNVSGIQEEDKSAVEASEKSLEQAVHKDDVRGENHLIPEAEDKNFHEKIEGLSSDDPSGDGDSHLEKEVLDEKEQDDTDLKPPSQYLEVPIEPTDAASQGSGMETAASSKEVPDYVKQIESNLEEEMLETSNHRIQKQLSIGRDEASNSTFDSKSASLEVDPKSDQHELLDIQAEPPVEDHSESPRESKEFLGLSILSQGEEKGHLIDNVIEENLASVVSDINNDLYAEKKTDDLLKKGGASREDTLLDINTCEEKCEIASEDEVGNDFREIKSTIPSNLGIKCEVEPPQEALPKSASSVDYFQEVSEPQDKSMILSEEIKLIGSGSENGENKCDPNQSQFFEQAVNELKSNDFNAKVNNIGNENAIDLSSSSGLEKVNQTEESEEITERVRELGTIPSEFTVTGHDCEEDKPYEKMEEKEEVSFEMGIDRDRTETNSTKPTQGLLSSPFNSQYLKGDTKMVSETAEYRNALIPDSNDNATNATAENLVSAIQFEHMKPEKELSQNVQLTPVRVAETKAQESVGRLSTESNPDIPSLHGELKKSPSFDFDLPLKRRYEESDQTPLLCHNRAETRSLSSRDDVRLQYEVVSVEEKTIRMERSDSEKPRAPFISLLKKEENGNVLVTPQKKDSGVANKNSAEELALTSRGSGKRRPRSSLFSTCICCAAVIH